MIERPETHPDKSATLPDPLVRAKNTVRRVGWPAAGLVVLLVALGIVFRHTEQWGDIATWVLAVTTLFALLAAAFAGLVAYDLLKIETSRDQQAAQERSLAAAERKLDHASRVSFWLTLAKVHTGHEEPYVPEAPYIAIVLHIVNTSDRPATSVMVMAGVRGDVWRDAGAADGVELDERGIEWTAPAIAPGARQEIRQDLPVPASVGMIVANYSDDALIGELLFTDAAGTSWAKSYPDGQLIERQSADWAHNMHLSLTQRDQQRRDRSRV
jgi:hypothetical protein